MVRWYTFNLESTGNSTDRSKLSRFYIKSPSEIASLKKAIKISSSFHNSQNTLTISYLNMKGEFSETTIIISGKNYSYKEKAT